MDEELKVLSAGHATTAHSHDRGGVGKDIERNDVFF